MQLPYLTVPIRLPGANIECEEPAPDKTVEAKIQPAQVEMYYPGYSWGTMLHFVSGCVMCVLPIEDYEALIKAYWQQVLQMSKGPKIKNIFQ